jgi:hypothetical protein
MLPDAAPLIPVEAQSPKHTGQAGLASGRNVQPNPLADNLGDFVLPRQPRPQIVQNRLGEQAAILAIPEELCGYLNATDDAPLLRDIQPETIGAFLREKRANTSTATAKQVRRVLSAFFNYAVDNRALPFSPVHHAAPRN